MDDDGNIEMIGMMSSHHDTMICGIISATTQLPNTSNSEFACHISNQNNRQSRSIFTQFLTLHYCYIKEVILIPEHLT